GVAILTLQVAGVVAALEVVREGDALLAQGGELGAALRYELVFRRLALVAYFFVHAGHVLWLGRVRALGAGGKAGLEAGFEEFVDVAIEHLLRVAALDSGAQVLDAALVEHVVADLAAPADVGLAGFQRVALDV